jgi:tetratricopeptide (TPR) repeat protein
VTGPPGRERPPAHDDHCAQRIRVLKLAEAGDPPSPPTELLHSIAAEIQLHCGQVPLRAYRLAYGWTIAAAIKALHSRCVGDGPSHPGVSKRAWQDWEAGKRPNRHNQDLLCRLFGTGPVELGFAQDYRGEEVSAVSADLAIPLARSRPVSQGDPWDRYPTARSFGAPLAGWERSVQPARSGGQGVEWDLVMNAAHESSEHAAAFESASVGPNALEQLGEDILRIARAYVHAPPLPLMTELIRVRDRAYWLLDRTRNPAQQRDLYLAAGQTCGLLASASFDLGYPHAAAQQARAARAYGEIIQGRELSAWADGMLACIEMWAGRPGQALLLAERGLTVAPDGTCRVRLWCIAARAAALQGDEQRAIDAIVASKRTRDTRAAPTDLHDSVGGEFGFGLARQAFCNGSAYLKLGRPEEALAECGQAVELYARAAAEERWYAAEAGARADLAAAHLLRGDLAGAREAVSEVLTLDPSKRVEGVIRRLGVLRDVLAGRGFQNREAQVLAEEIEQFTAAPAVQVLPAPPS